MPDVREFRKIIHKNQILSSKMCNEISESHCKSDYGQNTV